MPDHAGATEFEGIVAEMIPQLPRPAGWNPATLNRLRDANHKVLVMGALTYDNEHFVNADPQHPKSGHCGRFIPSRRSLSATRVRATPRIWSSGWR